MHGYVYMHSKAIEEFYEEDIPNKAIFAAEVEMWKQKCKELLQDDQIEKLRLVDALNIADKDYFPRSFETNFDFTSWFCSL